MKKLITILLSATLLLSLIPTVAFGGEMTNSDSYDFTKGTDQGSLEKDGFEWNEEKYTLKLNSFKTEGDITLPDDEPVKVVNEGNSAVGGIDFGTPGSSYGHTLNADITFKGTGNISVTKPVTSGKSDNLTIENGVALNAESGINIGTSGGRDSVITVNGILNSFSSEYDSGINCGVLKIKSKGLVNIEGERGVKVNGKSLENTCEKAFSMDKGAKFHADCFDYGLEVFSGNKEIKESDLDKIIDIPEGYIYDKNGKGKYTKKVITGENGETQYAATITGKDQTPVLEYEQLEGAGPLSLGYKIIEGDGAIWEDGISSELDFVCDSEYDWFVDVSVDGERLSIEDGDFLLDNETMTITLPAEKISLLGEGVHDIVVDYVGGQSGAEFTVRVAMDEDPEEPENPGYYPETPDAPGSVDDNISPENNVNPPVADTPDTEEHIEVPATGDTTNITLWIIIGIVAIIAVITLIIAKKKK